MQKYNEYINLSELGENIAVGSRGGGLADQIGRQVLGSCSVDLVRGD